MKLPKQAKQVFTGQIFDVYQWEQEQFDGSTATFEMLKRPNTVQIIATAGETIYVTHEEQPSKGAFRSLIGGRQDVPGESILDCAKRELLEEAGMVSDDWELLRIVSPYTKMDWEIHIFIARGVKKIKEQSLDAGEKIEILTVSFDEFCDLVFSEEFWGCEFAYWLLQMKHVKPKEFEAFRKRLTE